MRQLAIAVHNSNQGVSVIDTIYAIKNAGFKNVFIQWYDEKEWEYGQKEQVKLCKELGLNIIFAHLGYQNINAIWKEGKEGDELVVRYKKDLKYCKQNGIPMVVMHLISGDKEIIYGELGITRIRKIVEFARKLNMKVAFENTRIRGYLEYLLRNIRDYNMGICFDVGHCHAFFDDKLDFKYFEDRVFAVHLHDNDKSDDLHLLPFDGTVDWKRTVYNLKRARYRGPVTLEVIYRYDYLNLGLDEFYKNAYERGQKIAKYFGDEY